VCHLGGGVKTTGDALSEGVIMLLYLTYPEFDILSLPPSSGSITLPSVVVAL
jgi:hypothetical protein